MKRFIYILSLAISVILTSCEGLPNNGFEINESIGAKGVKMFAISTRGLIDESKSVGTFMYSGDALYNSSANFKYNLEDITVESDSKSKYALKYEDEQKVLYYPTTGTGTIYAYYPYVDAGVMPEINDMIYTVKDWNDQLTDESSCDLYVAKTEGSVEDKGVTKTLEFNHVFSRVVFNVKKSPTCTMDEKELMGLSLELSNLNNPISYNIKTGDITTLEVGEDVNTTLQFKVSTDDNGTIANAVVPPNIQINECQLKIRLVSGKEFSCTMPNELKLAPGRKYSWTVYVESNSIYVIAEMEDEIPYGGVF